MCVCLQHGPRAAAGIIGRLLVHLCLCICVYWSNRKQCACAAEAGRIYDSGSLLIAVCLCISVREHIAARWSLLGLVTLAGSSVPRQARRQCRNYCGNYGAGRYSQSPPLSKIPLANFWSRAQKHISTAQTRSTHSYSYFAINVLIFQTF